MKIGVDFDNTIICYDEQFHRCAVEWGFINPGFLADKSAIRHAVRLLHDGEKKWQRLQAEIYGVRVQSAQMMDGFKEFAKICRENRVTLYIVSHKTKYPSQNEYEVDLRHAALLWMNSESLFDRHEYRLERENIYFENTRAEKIDRVNELECEVFIDDLEEVLSDKGLSDSIEKILLSKSSFPGLPYRQFDCWSKISHYIKKLL